MDLSAENQGVEHLMMAADHLETAANFHRDAAKLYDARNEEKAAHHMLRARGEVALAQEHEEQASKRYASEQRQSK